MDRDVSMQLDRRQREHPRIPVRIPALAGAAEAPYHQEAGHVRDLSRGGLRLILPKTAAPGAEFRVTLLLRQQPPVAVVGPVVWSHPRADSSDWAMGIRFRETLPSELFAEIAAREQTP